MEDQQTGYWYYWRQGGLIVLLNVCIGLIVGLLSAPIVIFLGFLPPATAQGVALPAYVVFALAVYMPVAGWIYHHMLAPVRRRESPRAEVDEATRRRVEEELRKGE